MARRTSPGRYLPAELKPIVKKNVLLILNDGLMTVKAGHAGVVVLTFKILFRYCRRLFLMALKALTGGLNRVRRTFGGFRGGSLCINFLDDKKNPPSND